RVLELVVPVHARLRAGWERALGDGAADRAAADLAVLPLPANRHIWARRYAARQRGNLTAVAARLPEGPARPKRGERPGRGHRRRALGRAKIGDGVEGLIVILVLIGLGIAGFAWFQRTRSSPLGQRADTYWRSEHTEQAPAPASREPTVETLRPGDAVSFWDGE